MSYPIYVASKGRPDAPTFTTLAASNLLYNVLVEPQDEEAYRQARPRGAHFIPLADNDRGLAYVRQRALDIARAAGGEWFWMLDDDIRGFYRAHDRKAWPAPADEVLAEAEAAITVDDFVGQGALEYQQYAWSNEPGKITRNSYADVAVLIKSGVMADYREELPLKVDRDFTLQVLASGHDVVRLGWLAFGVPGNGTNEGGQHDVYDSLTDDGMRREEWASRRLADLWPGIVEFKVKPNGRPDAKIHWRKMRS